MKAVNWQLVTGATEELLTLPELKQHLRIDHDVDDELIAAYAQAAIESCAEYMGRAVLTQTWDVWFDDWPGDGKLELPLPPLQSVTSVKYTPAGAAQQTLAPATYQVLTQLEPARIVLAYGQDWPSETLDAGLPVVVRMVCGWAAPGVVPQGIQQAVRWVAGHMYEHREAVTMTNVPPQQLPMSVQWALQPHRVRYVW